MQTKRENSTRDLGEDDHVHGYIHVDTHEHENVDLHGILSWLNFRRHACLIRISILNHHKGKDFIATYHHNRPVHSPIELLLSPADALPL